MGLKRRAPGAGLADVFARLALALAVAVLGAAAGAAPGHAQQAQRESVTGRARPEYQPNGIRLDDALKAIGSVNVGRNADVAPEAEESLGSFLLHPGIELETVYDDNLFRQESDEVSDVVFRLMPSFRLVSDWANHAFSLAGGAAIARHVDNPDENYVDLDVAVGGRVDIDVGETLDGRLSWARGHEDRASPDDIGAPEPTVFNTTRLAITHATSGRGVYGTRATGAATYTDFVDNGATNNDDRDRLQLEGRFRLTREVDEGTRVFGEAAANTRIYDDDFDDLGQEQGSSGWEALAGLVWDFSGVTYFELGVGYLSQHYEEATFPTISGVSFRGKMVWNPTGLLTVTGTVDRSVGETTQAGVAGTLDTLYSLNVDWEALYNLIVSAGGSFKSQEFEGSTRSEDTVDLYLRARWLITNNYYLEARAASTDRDSNLAGESFTNNRFLIILGEQL